MSDRSCRHSYSCSSDDCSRQMGRPHPRNKLFSTLLALNFLCAVAVSLLMAWRFLHRSSLQSQRRCSVSRSFGPTVGAFMMVISQQMRMVSSLKYSAEFSSVSVFMKSLIGQGGVGTTASAGAGAVGRRLCQPTAVRYQAEMEFDASYVC